MEYTKNLAKNDFEDVSYVPFDAPQFSVHVYVSHAALALNKILQSSTNIMGRFRVGSA